MALPLILGLLGSTLGAGATTGILGTLGAVGAGAVGSGLGRFAETGDFEEGLKTFTYKRVKPQPIGKQLELLFSDD